MLSGRELPNESKVCLGHGCPARFHNAGIGMLSYVPMHEEKEEDEGKKRKMKGRSLRTTCSAHEREESVAAAGICVLHILEHIRHLICQFTFVDNDDPRLL